MKQQTSIVKHFVFAAIFGVALLFGFGATKTNAQTYQDRYYNDGYNNNNYYRQDRHHQKDEKRDLKQHQRDERKYEGNSWWLREHQRQERQELKHHQWHEKQDNRRSSRNGYYPYNY